MTSHLRSMPLVSPEYFAAALAGPLRGGAASTTSASSACTPTATARESSASWCRAMTEPVARASRVWPSSTSAPTTRTGCTCRGRSARLASTWAPHVEMADLDAQTYVGYDFAREPAERRTKMQSSAGLGRPNSQPWPSWTPSCCEQRALTLGLDALGDDVEAHRQRHRDDRADDLGVVGVVLDAGDERAVDLDLGHGEPAQVAQRRVAGAEVVDGERSRPSSRSRCSSVAATSLVGHHRRLGDLQDEQARRARRGGAAALPRRGRPATASRSCRAETFTATHSRAPGRPLRAPARELAQRLGTTHSPISTMSPVSSAIGMKSSGETMPRLGCAQRISASTPTTSPVCDGDDRLVVQQELVAVQRVPQRELGLHPAPDRVVHRAVERPCTGCGRRPWPGTSPCRRRAAGPRRVGRVPRRPEPRPIDTVVDQRVVRAQRRRGRRRRCPPRASSPSRAAARRRRSARRTNSSPPMPGHDVGRRRRCRRSRSAAARSTWSPTWWPQVSLTSLNASRSRKSRSTRPPSRSARRHEARRPARPARAGWRARSARRGWPGSADPPGTRRALRPRRPRGQQQQGRRRRRAAAQTQSAAAGSVPMTSTTDGTQRARGTRTTRRARDQDWTGRGWMSDSAAIDGCSAAAPKQPNPTMNGRSSSGEPTTSPCVPM